ncbi:MAG: hypothetical protein J0M16_01185 [Gammaproteobacteria bacterium]|nr:hypothetical protein [Gammaproteobacteria bacterium]
MNKLRTAIAALFVGALSSAGATALDSSPGIRIVGQAIDGTLILDNSVSALTALNSPGLALPSNTADENAPTLLVLGHVEALDQESGTITVSGQRITLDQSAVVIDAPRDIDAPLNPTNASWYLQPGRYVAIAGVSFGSGEALATHVVRLDNEAQPGTVPIYVRGSLDSLDQLQGVAHIGGMTMDLTGLSAMSAASVGNVVELVGFQSDATSARVTEIASLELEHASKAAHLTGITGSGAKAKGINGSGVKGITGSGAKAKGINGSGVKGITGSGAKAKGINGSGVKGITGSGAKAKGINGSGVKR